MAEGVALSVAPAESVRELVPVAQREAPPLGVPEEEALPVLDLEREGLELAEAVMQVLPERLAEAVELLLPVGLPVSVARPAVALAEAEGLTESELLAELQAVAFTEELALAEAVCREEAEALALTVPFMVRVGSPVLPAVTVALEDPEEMPEAAAEAEVRAL